MRKEIEKVLEVMKTDYREWANRRGVTNDPASGPEIVPVAHIRGPEAPWAIARGDLPRYNVM